MGALQVFELCVTRARNLIKIHEAAHGKKSKPEKYLADAHRAAIVLAVSALDAFVRTYVIEGVRQLVAIRNTPLPEHLSTHIKKFLKEDGLLDAARNDDLLDRVERSFRVDANRKSFQGTKNISEYMLLVGIADVFHDVAIKAAVNEETLKKDLDRFTTRRHVIAHQGDHDLTQNPPKENAITKHDAEECIQLVKTVAEAIDKLK